MKAIYRCDFCDKMGTAEEIMQHEESCVYNYNKRSCMTCKFADNKITKFNCTAGKEIPEGQMFTGCDKYEWDKVDHTKTPGPSALTGLSGGLFG